MIRKYHNHKMQTKPWHPEEEPHNNHETTGRQTKHSNQLSLQNILHGSFERPKHMSQYISKKMASIVHSKSLLNWIHMYGKISSLT